MVEVVLTEPVTNKLKRKAGGRAARKDKDAKPQKLAQKLIQPPSSIDSSSLSQNKRGVSNEHEYPLALRFRVAVKRYEMLLELNDKFIEFSKVRNDPYRKETVLRLYNEIQSLGSANEIRDLLKNTHSDDPIRQIREVVDIVCEEIFTLGIKLIVNENVEIEANLYDTFQEIIRQMQRKKSFQERKDLFLAYPSEVLKNLFSFSEKILFGYELLKNELFVESSLLIKEEEILLMADPDRGYINSRDYQEAIHLHLHTLLVNKCLSKSEDPFFAEDFQKLVRTCRCLSIDCRIAFFKEHAMRKRPLFDLFTLREKEEILFSRHNPLPIIRPVAYSYFLTPKELKHFALSLIQTSKLFDIIPFSYFLVCLCNVDEKHIEQYSNLFSQANDRRSFLKECLLRQIDPAKLLNQRSRLNAVAKRLFLN